MLHIIQHMWSAEFIELWSVKSIVVNSDETSPFYLVLSKNVIKYMKWLKDLLDSKKK